MTATEFIKIINNPIELNKISSDTLQKMMEQYPYFSTLRMLAVKKNKSSSSKPNTEELSLASVYAPDRGKLYEFLNTSISVAAASKIIPLDSKVEEKEAEKKVEEKKTKIVTKLVAPPPVFCQTISTDPPSIQIELAITKEEEKSVEEESILSIEEWLKDFEPARIQEKEKKTTRKGFKLPRIPILKKDLLDILDSPKGKKKTKAKKVEKAEKTKKKALLKEPAKEKITKKEKKERVEEIFEPLIKEEKISTQEKNDKSIDSFLLQTKGLLNSLNIKGKESFSVSSDEEWEDDSMEENEEIVSETLANLLAGQGQNKKAIKMYEALSLKFPEKNRLFADKITELKA